MGRIRVALTGDSLMTRPLSTVHDPALSALRDLIGSVDVAFTNLEFIAAHPPLVPRPRWHGLHVNAPTRALDELVEFGFNLFSLAHNHTMDYSAGGLLQTLDALDRRAMVCAGAGRTLTEARRPRYLDGPGFRAAVLAACSTDAPATIAADPDGMTDGRPGISGLRFSTDYELRPEQYAALAEIDEELGTAAGTRMAEALTIVLDGPATGNRRSFRFLNGRFVEAGETRVRTIPNPFDVEDISRWVHEAGRQADLVIVSLHCHEGAGGQYNQDTVADFALEAARRFVDAGADLFVGHGPHQLAGMEIYKGKPIFHSLGNFVFMPETVEILPTEFLRAAGLPPGATPSDFQDRREGGGEASPGFTGFSAYWESVMPICVFDDGQLREVRLTPIVLDPGTEKSRRGVPFLADGERGREILSRYATLAQPFGARVEIVESAGRVTGVVGP